MTVSAEAKRRLETAVTSKKVADELVAAIDAPGSGPAAVVVAFGATTNLTALAPAAVTMTAAATAGGAAPTAAQVDAAINAATAEIKGMLDAKTDNVDAETLRTEVEARLDALEAKVNAILVSLKAASYMATA